MSTIDDMDAVKLSLYFLLGRVLIDRGSRYHLGPWMLRMVDDLDQFN